jgi:predicted unusual protein kinase regulating ubiquinone biosynthesis (AarF/ABC1/UbiB family)
VAVKVQYPGIAATITSDMQLMRAALRALAHTDMPLPANTVVDSVMTEIEATLLREVDYLQEAEQLQWFAQHAALPGVVLAQPILSHTRAQVLTQQFLPGQHLQDWLASQPTQAQRDRAGQHLWDWFMHCLFVLGRVHADPHPGNFLFAPDGTVGVLDFGCTRSLSEHFRTQVTKAWSALLRPPTDPQRDALVLQAYQALGLVNASLTVPAYTAELAPALADMQAWQMEPFTQPIFDFGVKTPPPITAGRHQRMLGEHLVQVPGEMPAFERMWMGLMHLLTGLGARVHTHCPALLPS